MAFYDPRQFSIRFTFSKVNQRMFFFKTIDCVLLRIPVWPFQAPFVHWFQHLDKRLLVHSANFSVKNGVGRDVSK